MNAFLIGLLQSALQSAISSLLYRISNIDFNVVKTECLALLNANMTGDEKRKVVFRKLRELSKETASWILNAAIEIAVGKLQQEYPLLGSTALANPTTPAVTPTIIK